MVWETALAVAIGKALLSASVRKLFEQMASRKFHDFFRDKKLDHKGFQTLKWKLLAVHSVLNDAEEQLHFMNLSVKGWLGELKDTLYSAEDLFDEIATEILKHDVEAGYQTPKEKVKALNKSLTEIVEKLELIAEEKDFLGLKEGPSDKSLPSFPTTSLVNESDECLRNEEKEQIVDFLLSDSTRRNGNEIPVIAIAGMAGIGKTTLAQFVYNDTRVKSHFNLRAWAYVSQRSSDVYKVTETIYESTTWEGCNTKDLNALQVKLGWVLKGKKFLLVLDDMWSESLTDWELLQKPFQVGAGGSKIIVTTRNQSVSTTMHSVLVKLLNPLKVVACWSIFAKHVFGKEDVINEDPILVSIGDKIVKKCQGLPLAAKTLGSLLRSKVEAKEWEDVLKNKIWDLPRDKSPILPALRLSYNYLPSHLKQCFAYCCIFPKGHEIAKGDLVRLWIAEGLVQQQKGARTTVEVGEQYFDELVSRSFFQRSDPDGSHFTMHDLLNDLAQNITGEFSCNLEDDSLPFNPERVRHLSCIPVSDERPAKYEAFCEVFNRLRTFLPFKSSPTPSNVSLTPIISDSLFPSDDESIWKKLFTKSGEKKNNLLTESDQDRKTNLFPESSCLRVLSLSPYAITNLPESIGNLKNLRYLDLSYTGIQSLPASVCTLYNLETLKLAFCFELTQLPENMRNLRKLEHLDIKESKKVKKMPVQFGNLTNLQLLTRFVVSRDSTGSRISELKKLSLLRGSLTVECLQDVFQTADSSEANLANKKYLDELTLRWAPPGARTVHREIETEVLDKLRPHEYLKKLRIQHFGGSKLPDWLGEATFSQMVSLHFDGCENCSFLPPLGQLPCLQDLSIKRMKGLRCIGPEFYGSGTNLYQPFRSLEILQFEGLSDWQQWLPLAEEGGFPSLKQLILKTCRALVGNLPSHFPSLIELQIIECRKLNCPDANGRNQYSTLERLHIRNSCDDLQTFSLGCFTGLVKLKLKGCKFLISIGLQNDHEDRYLTFFQELKIEDCPELEIFSGNGLPSLQKLKISRCRKLYTFGDGGLPTSLQSICFQECPNLPQQDSRGLQNMPLLISYEINGDRVQQEQINGIS